MARAGRKRKIGERYPNGQLKPKKQDVDDRVRTTRQPHRRVVAHEMRAIGIEDIDVRKAAAGEEAESPIGRLWLTGRLRLKSDPDEAASRFRYDAGNMFAQVVGAYRSVIESPRDVAGSGKGYPCEPEHCLNVPDDCQCLKRRRRYTDAYEAIAGRLHRLSIDLEFGADAPETLRNAIAENRRLRDDEAYVPAAAARRRVLMAVVRVAIHREGIGDEELVYLVQGLEELRHHFGLTERRKRNHSSNAN